MADLDMVIQGEVVNGTLHTAGIRGPNPNATGLTAEEVTSNLVRLRTSSSDTHPKARRIKGPKTRMGMGRLHHPHEAVSRMAMAVRAMEAEGMVRVPMGMVGSMGIGVAQREVHIAKVLLIEVGVVVGTAMAEDMAVERTAVRRTGVLVDVDADGGGIKRWPLLITVMQTVFMLCS